MFQCAMRQVEERHVAYQVDLMVWSNRLDLLAISNFKGKFYYCWTLVCTRILRIVIKPHFAIFRLGCVARN